MPVPHVSENFPDVLDPRFQRIATEEYRQLPDMIPEIYDLVPHNGRNNMMWSEIGTLPDFEEFAGSIEYKSQAQGFDVTAEFVEWALGVQIERKLVDDDQYPALDRRPEALAAAAQRTRQKHAARMFNRAFTVNSDFYTHSEGVALCSDSHTTNTEASTATGFDNLGTASMSAVAVQAARVQMRGFRGDQGERITVMPDELVYPPNLEETAFEIISSSGKVDTALNNRNIHLGRYRGIDWEYLTDDNNWFVMDSFARRRSLKWVDRIPIEFAMVEDFDSLIAKFRGYMRYAYAWLDWRFIMGHQVS